MVEPTFSLHDIVDQQTQLEAAAAEAIPFSFSSCTYATLEEARQPVYSCLSCRPVPLSPEDRAGICAGCSVSCHGDCELVELFSRRNFICDCGTSRLSSRKCALTFRDKEAPSSQNKYDDNFDGIFCSCKTQYDPELEEDEMVQCLICEDWYHSEKCLTQSKSATPLHRNVFEHLVCDRCVLGKGAQTVGRYAGTAKFLLLGEDRNPLVKEPGENTGLMSRLVDEEGHPETTTNRSTLGSSDISSPVHHSGKRVRPQDEEANIITTKRLKPDLGMTVETNPRDLGCTAPSEGNQLLYTYSREADPRHVYLVEGWREQWCRCPRCMPLYTHLPYLLEEESVYEPPTDPDASKSIHDLGTAALMQMPREQAVQGLEAYTSMRDKLRAYLAPFARDGKVVSKSDIQNFFAQQKADV